MVVSDHVPLILTCKQHLPRRTQHRIELSWLHCGEVDKLINRIWQEPQQEVCPLLSFNTNIGLMHCQLAQWHRSSLLHAPTQLDTSQQVIVFFDKIEEKRNLAVHEFRTRQKIRQKAYELSCGEELKWMQRSRCKWLAEGDKNTRFFHAFASVRSRKSRVSLIESEGQTVNDEAVIRLVFFENLKRPARDRKAHNPF